MVRAVTHLVVAASALGLIACVPGCATSEGAPVSGRRIAVHGAPRISARRPPRPPKGFVTMTVIGVLPVGEGHAVFLIDGHRQKILPILVGDTEALSIDLRLHHQRFERPLTHDLLDTLVTDLGGRIVEARIDGIADGAFVGSLVVAQANRTIRIDARPSDAIALAVGDGVPIFVAEKVLATAGIDRRDLENAPPEAPGDPDGAPDRPTSPPTSPDAI